MVDDLDLHEMAEIKRSALNRLNNERTDIGRKYTDQGIDVKRQPDRMDPIDRQRLNEIASESQEIRRLKEKGDVESYFADQTVNVPIGGKDSGFWQEQTGWTAREGNQGYYELVEEFVSKRGSGAAEDLVRKVISDEYGRKKIAVSYTHLTLPTKA